MNEKKKFSYDVRQIDAWTEPAGGWTWNSSYHIGTMETAADPRRALPDYLRRKHGIIFKRNRTRIEYDGSIYEIQDRKTKEPLYAAIPNF